MAKRSTTKTSAQGRNQTKDAIQDVNSLDLQDMLWRVERLERQVRRLSELVREHAVDADRLVQIVAEDREMLRRALLTQGIDLENTKAASLPSSDVLDIISS